MDIRSVQKPLKDQYRNDPNKSRITLTARGGQTETPIACSVDIGRAMYQAQAHTGVGGSGTAACSGDLLLGALAACAQITCQMVAAAMGIRTDTSTSRLKAIWIFGARWVYQKMCPSALTIFDFVSRFLRRMRQRRNYAVCAKRQNNIV